MLHNMNVAGNGTASGRDSALASHSSSVKMASDRKVMASQMKKQNEYESEFVGICFHDTFHFFTEQRHFTESLGLALKATFSTVVSRHMFTNNHLHLSQFNHHSMHTTSTR
jgi:hypothetical protein